MSTASSRPSWDADSHPWLTGLDDAGLADIAVELTGAICRPSFGSLSKREFEQKVFALLYARRGEAWRTLGDIADDLAISRARARALVLEYRARQAGAMGRGQRSELLRKEVLSWPSRHVDQQADQLRIVIDDPFIRDILKNFAYSRGILVDQSFSGEILVFTWDAYGQLLSGVYDSGSGISQDDVTTICSDLRAQIKKSAMVARVQEGILKKELTKLDKAVDEIVNTNQERRAAKVREFAKTYGPLVVKPLLSHIAGP